MHSKICQPLRLIDYYMCLRVTYCIDERDYAKLSQCHEINSHEINSHEINFHESNSHEINSHEIQLLMRLIPIRSILIDF